MTTPPEDLQSAANAMVRDCIQQIDPTLADSVVALAPPDHKLNVWREEKGEQVIVMTGTLNGAARFDAVCVFTLNGKGTVTVHFKSGTYQNKRCTIPTARVERNWRATVSDLKWLEDEEEAASGS